jgi:hypothetical protein
MTLARLRYVDNRQRPFKDAPHIGGEGSGVKASRVRAASAAAIPSQYRSQLHRGCQKRLTERDPLQARSLPLRERLVKNSRCSCRPTTGKSSADIQVSALLR